MTLPIAGLRVGHWTDLEALTGCTVVLPPPGTRAAVFIPGNAPATRETDAIAPGRRVEFVSAIALTGGSAFGLGVADGVMRWLEERGIGHPAPMGPVPIVPTAAIYDLLIGDASRRPGPAEGYAACEAATDNDPVQGVVGAGTGATCGKTAGFEHMSKSGLGCATRTAGDVTVHAIAVVNAVGDVVDEDGSVIAGARAAPLQLPPVEPRTSTTIACVTTDAALDPHALRALAEAAAAGLGQAIRPVYTIWDGDTVFALSTGTKGAPVGLGDVAAASLADACRNAAGAATDAGGIPARGARAPGGGA